LSSGIPLAFSASIKPGAIFFQVDSAAFSASSNNLSDPESFYKDCAISFC
jgi:hypothetical protein